MALVELVRIPRMCEEGTMGFPFGPAVDQALHKSLHITGDSGPNPVKVGIMASLKLVRGQKCWVSWGTWMWYLPGS
jgi:hypothetical protein